MTVKPACTPPQDFCSRAPGGGPRGRRPASTSPLSRTQRRSLNDAHRPTPDQVLVTGYDQYENTCHLS